jgi:hypothetical protein
MTAAHPLQKNALERFVAAGILVFDFELFVDERCDFYIGLNLVQYRPQQISSFE